MINNCNWERINGFSSIGEYNRFVLWLESQVISGVIENIPVSNPSKDLIFGVEEAWFKCSESKEIWRLISPSFPFAGLWEPLKNENE